jgi:hypothetical protein
VTVALGATFIASQRSWGESACPDAAGAPRDTAQPGFGLQRGNLATPAATSRSARVYRGQTQRGRRWAATNRQSPNVQWPQRSLETLEARRISLEGDNLVDDLR